MIHWKLLGYSLITASMMLVVMAPVAQAVDQAPKPDEQLAATITVGQAQWLESGGERFLGIYTQSTTGTPLGAAIILPGLDAHPDWPDVIAPLRRGLPAYGWSTLSIQLTTHSQGPDGRWLLEPYFTASRNRIQAAISFLEKQGITNIALIGHGLGAAAAAVSVSGSNPLKVSGLAAISLGIPPHSGPSPYQPGVLENIHVPMLDIFGSRDLDPVTHTAAARLAAAQRGGLDATHNQQFASLLHSAMARLPTTEQNGYIAYRQLELMGADYRFRGAEPTLVKRVAGWLKKHAV
jgi:hypothetical protein